MGIGASELSAFLRLFFEAFRCPHVYAVVVFAGFVVVAKHKASADDKDGADKKKALCGSRLVQPSSDEAKGSVGSFIFMIFRHSFV